MVNSVTCAKERRSWALESGFGGKPSPLYGRGVFWFHRGNRRAFEVYHLVLIWGLQNVIHDLLKKAYHFGRLGVSAISLNELIELTGCGKITVIGKDLFPRVRVWYSLKIQSCLWTVSTSTRFLEKIGHRPTLFGKSHHDRKSASEFEDKTSKRTWISRSSGTTQTKSCFIFSGNGKTA